MARCPAHDDKNPSLAVGEGQELILLHCHAGCAVEEVVQALGLEMRDLYHDSGNGANGRGEFEIEATFDYETVPLSQVVRLAGKRFVQRHRCPTGRDGWSWDLGGRTCACPRIQPVLFQLSATLKAAEAGGVIWVCEGERDADRLSALQLTATTNPGGAGKWRKAYSEALAGAHIIIIPDNDKLGREQAQKAARAVYGTAASIKIVELLGVPPKGDVSDFLDGNHDHVRALLELAKAAPEWKPLSRGDNKSEDVSSARQDDYELEDSGNAKRLVKKHGDDLRFLPGWDKWIVWNEARRLWVLDYQDVQIRERGKDVGHSLKQESDKAFQRKDGELAKKLFGFAVQSLNAGKIGSMVNLARGIEGIPLNYERLDANPWVLGVQNGVLDLRTAQLRADDAKALLLTKQCPVAFDPAATCPRWERAMEEWFPDGEVREFVQWVAGAALVGEQRDHVLIIHWGEGANGKGTFIRALRRVLGPYTVVIHLALIEQTRQTVHDTERAHLFRARLAVAAETERRIRLREASVKNLTGGDPIHARHCYEDPWEFEPSHSLWIQTNHLPEISGRDHGIWRRIKVVKWVTRFDGKSADPNLDEKLAGETPGILNWLLTGCLAWQKEGRLLEPQAVINETIKYRESQDVLAKFATDVGLEFQEGLAIAGQSLRELFAEWKAQEGVRVWNKDLSDWLTEHGVQQVTRRIDRRDRRFWKGVGRPGTEDGPGGRP
jgi:putative DNA primase/helicase